VLLVAQAAIRVLLAPFFSDLWDLGIEPIRIFQTVSLGTWVNSVGCVGMAVIKRLSAVPIRFGGEEHFGWLPANAATPPPTPVEEALVDFEISDVEGGYITYSNGTHETRATMETCGTRLLKVP
jgi:hypothetical protein